MLKMAVNNRPVVPEGKRKPGETVIANSKVEGLSVEAHADPANRTRPEHPANTMDPGGMMLPVISKP
jgi:hypothetical protein